LIDYSAEALEQIRDLRADFERKRCIEAVRALILSLTEAEQQIKRHPAGGLRAPRPYPERASLGRRWIKSDRYWVAYSASQPPVIISVFYDQANIPGRFK